MRAPFELGWRPSPSSMMPAFTSSSLYLPIALSISVSGGVPASVSSFALTITMTRIRRSFQRVFAGTSNEIERNRHGWDPRRVAD